MCFARQDQDAGLPSVFISDHSTLDRAARGPFVWSVMGAMAATTDVDVRTEVTCPIVRIHLVVHLQLPRATRCWGTVNPVGSKADSHDIAMARRSTACTRLIYHEHFGPWPSVEDVDRPSCRGSLVEPRAHPGPPEASRSWTRGRTGRGPGEPGPVPGEFISRFSGAAHLLGPRTRHSAGLMRPAGTAGLPTFTLPGWGIGVATRS